MKKILLFVMAVLGFSALSGCAQHYANISDIPFVDPNFKRCVILQGKAYSEQITELKCEGQHISQIKELSNFKNLKQLDLSQNQLTKLDVSDNPHLEVLSLEHNLLNKLKVKSNRQLKVLNVSFNRLTDLDVRKNKELTYLNYEGNPLSNVDIHQNPQLVEPFSKIFISNGPSQ
ncbi:hypothetical protein C0W80_01960 [Photobacterium leiognathi subsp. mandapamensis]|uniref:hypothetical protein n=1 Tax=Photobacterium leiognathi TaxID=553611 RepID=UPI000D1595E5|nr:hypothetical protein [Photobacterium leiognathi]PSV04134.1 hypothetical protein C0W80_01960 [Photobacterium leiognathi subsp. mandapamensis]